MTQPRYVSIVFTCFMLSGFISRGPRPDRAGPQPRPSP